MHTVNNQGPFFHCSLVEMHLIALQQKAAGSSQNWWFLDLGFSKSMRMEKVPKNILPNGVLLVIFYGTKTAITLHKSKKELVADHWTKIKRLSKHRAVVSMHLQLAPVWHGEASSPKQGSKTCLVPARLCRGCDFLSQIPRLSCNFAILWPVKIPLEHIDVWTKAIVRSYHGNTQATCTFRGKFFHPYFRAEKNFILSSFCIVLGAKVWTSSFEPRTQVA